MKENKTKHTNSSGMAENEMVNDTRAPSAQYVQTKELGTSPDELLVKIRKPYTITKQREKWTEEEHEKFLEALKLYGRAWRQIQEHIGNKTAVQIRSHAQKFFSKVGREAGKEDTIKIPPPRPKRKPLHPYPRKVSHSCAAATMEVQKTEPSISANPSVGQESGSPVSGLSAVGSDSGAFSISNPPISSILPASSPVGLSETETLLCKDENGHCSPATSDVAITRNNEPLTEFNTSLKYLPSLEQDSLKAVESISLKLFGKDIVLTEPQKSSSSFSRSGSQMLPNTIGDERSSIDVENTSHCFKLFPSDGNFLGLPTVCPWNTWHGEAAATNHCLPSHDTTVLAPLPIDTVRKEENAAECDDVSCLSTISPKRTLISNANKNIFLTDGLGLPKERAPSFKLKPSQNSAFSVVKACNNMPSRDFATYKRCTDEQQAEKSSNMDTDREIHAAELCL